MFGLEPCSLQNHAKICNINSPNHKHVFKQVIKLTSGMSTTVGPSSNLLLFSIDGVRIFTLFSPASKYLKKLS